MPTEHVTRSLPRIAVIVLALAAVGAIVWVQAWHGPTVVTLSAAHGVDTGDLIALPFLLLALAFARGRPSTARSRPRDWPLPAAAITLGVLLLFTGLLAGQGGSLVPAGGATLDGRIAQTFATRAVEAGRWNSVA